MQRAWHHTKQFPAFQCAIDDRNDFDDRQLQMLARNFTDHFRHWTCQQSIVHDMRSFERLENAGSYKAFKDCEDNDLLIVYSIDLT